jgi:hypothetical protein
VTGDKESRSPNANNLRVAPEYAGNGLAAALGKSSTAAGAAAPPQSADEWVVFGVDTVDQIAAENAARAAGQSLGQWLSDLIADAATEKK